MDKVNTDGTRDSYCYAMWQFSIWCKKSPDQLIQERKGTDGYAAVDQVQNFIKHGEVQTSRTYPSGVVSNRTIKIYEHSLARRSLLYQAIKSFYMYNRAALPPDKFRITKNHTAENAVETRTTYMTLDQGRDIIKASKSPYREFFSCQLYGGLGRREALLINVMWPKLREQMKEGKEILRLDYNYRKSNDQEDAPFFTFIPAKILAPFKDAPMPWMIKGKPMKEWHLYKVWHNACLRAGVKADVRPHLYRDLMITDGRANAQIAREYLDFMVGHTVDKNNYLQLMHKPEKVLEQWLKWKAYVDSELVNEATQKELEQNKLEIKALAEQNKRFASWAKVSLQDQIQEAHDNLIKAINDKLPEDEITSLRGKVNRLEAHLRELPA